MTSRVLLLVLWIGMSVFRVVHAQTNAQPLVIDDLGQVRVKEKEPMTYYQQLLDAQKSNTKEYLEKQQAQHQLDQKKKKDERANLQLLALQLQGQREKEKKEELEEKQVKLEMKEQMLAGYIKQFQAQAKQRTQAASKSLQKKNVPPPESVTSTEQSSKSTNDGTARQEDIVPSFR